MLTFTKLSHFSAEPKHEDLMTRLAEASDGNHAFARTADDLATIFNFELGDLLSVVATDVRVRITFAPNVRPIRVLGRKAAVHGRFVTARINQLYADQEKFLLVEVALPPGEAGSSRNVATAQIDFRDSASRTRATLSSAATIRYSRSDAEIAAGRNDSVLVSTIELIANDNNRRAVSLRDNGRKDEAERILERNVDYLERNAAIHNSAKLKKLAGENKKDKAEIKSPARVWKKRRKEMRSRQYSLDQQMAW